MFFLMSLLHDGIVLAFGLSRKLTLNYGIMSLALGFGYILLSQHKEILEKLSKAYIKSLIDPLTGAYNRGILSELKLESESVFIFVDLNNFKMVNDSFGHEKGDFMLKELVKRVKENIRKTDLVVRMGGDEFLIILKGCNTEKAYEIIQKTHSEFAQNYPYLPAFSYGIAPLEKSIEATIIKADALMYKMKESEKTIKENKTAF